MACPRIIENFLSALTFMKLCRMPFYFFNFFFLCPSSSSSFSFSLCMFSLSSLHRSSSICLLFPFLSSTPPFRSCSPLFLFLLLFSVHPSVFHVSSHFFLSSSWFFFFHWPSLARLHLPVRHLYCPVVCCPTGWPALSVAIYWQPFGCISAMLGFSAMSWSCASETHLGRTLGRILAVLSTMVILDCCHRPGCHRSPVVGPLSESFGCPSGSVVLRLSPRSLAVPLRGCVCGCPSAGFQTFVRPSPSGDYLRPFDRPTVCQGLSDSL